MIVAVRGLLLLTALFLFAGSLVSQSLAEANRHYSQQPDWSRCPGLRVLLTDPGTGRNDHNDKITLIPLQELIVTCPDKPERQHIVGVGTRLELMPAGQDGMVVFIPAMNVHENWAVRTIDVIPLRYVTGNTQDAPLATTHRLLQQTEAANREPVFTLQYGTLKRHYRGCLRITPATATSVYAVNYLPIEAYLSGLIEAEMSGSWPEQALKAQAIAARSLAYAHQLTNGDKDWDITDGHRDPTYRGAGNGSLIIDAAIKETHGQVLTITNDPFPAHFHASSGGYTAQIEDVWPEAKSSTQQLPLTQVMHARPDPWCEIGVTKRQLQDSHWQRAVNLPIADLREALRRHDINDVWPTGLIVTFHPESDRVKKVVIKVWNRAEAQIHNNYELSGHDFRDLIGLDRIRSTRWTGKPQHPDVRQNPNQRGYSITTIGWGHGVGMSQISAYAMADAGWHHHDILDFFYTDTALQRRW